MQAISCLLCPIHSSSGSSIIILPNLRQRVGAGSGSEGMMSAVLLHSCVSLLAAIDLVHYQQGTGVNGSRECHTTVPAGTYLYCCCLGDVHIEGLVGRGMWETGRSQSRVPFTSSLPPPIARTQRMMTGD